METAEQVLCRSLASGRFAVLDNNRSDGGTVSYFFHDPLAFCVATSPDEVAPALEEVERHVQAGCHAVGYFSYELGYSFSPRLEKILPARRDAPLLCVGIYRNRLDVSDCTLEAALEAHTRDQRARILNCHLNMTKAQYLEQLAKVKQHIFDGDTYQVNYTLKYKFHHEGAPLKLFTELRKRQRVEFGAFLDFPGMTVLSRSPELFIEKKGEDIHTRPMKGTSKRGLTSEQDAHNAASLANDAKTRAENVMIVDLLRNDLSRISRRGSVKTTDLFKIETYETLHQLVSTVAAKVDDDISFQRVLSQLFPCGSVTGAPKVRTMEIINDLELEPRGVYTGAIGYLGPDRSMCLNVAIRTLALWPDGRGEMGVGSGIVHDSDPEAEYEECRLKGRFLTDQVADFNLIECVRFDGGYQEVDRHLARLSRSAEALGFEFDRERLASSLDDLARTLTAPTKVRVVLDRQGHLEIECSPIAAPGRHERRIALSPECTQSSSWLLQHKVSIRPLYERMYARYSQLGYYDVIFTNERGEVTEGTFHNVFVRRGGRWYTPPVSCGLLPGIQRQVLLESPELNVVEKRLYVRDLAEADEIVLTNAIRGVVKTRLDLTIEDSPCFV
ncbi:aminodeoxychorismate synthase component I [Sorangium sp. So ce1000]|uniref:aminodeoxychorismate synthase component I n=1 Tax=Sorangium sp. So ce1000 TaxID=3133325 RepID=UPI003F604463